MKDRDEIQAALRQVGKALHEQFEDEGGTHAARLAQLDVALTNAEVIVGHVFDEEERELDLARRIVGRETVHQGHEVRSPVGRPHEHYATVARRAR